MSTRLAAVGLLDDQRPTGPVHRSIIAVDLEGSTMRTNPVKGELRRAMYDLLGHSLEAVAITGDRLERLTDRGDGILVLIRPHDDVPKTVLLDQLIPLLATLLAEYNARTAQPTLRIRLRAVVHAGEVHMDSRGFYGEAIDVAIRLLDARPVKKALKRATAPLVLVVSDEIYTGIVCHGYVDADAYLPLVQVRVANRRHRGWVHIPPPLSLPEPRQAVSRRARPFIGARDCGRTGGTPGRSNYRVHLSNRGRPGGGVSSAIRTQRRR
jgi:hypothetical protein